jgi:hypothetical protein
MGMGGKYISAGTNLQSETVLCLISIEIAHLSF